LEGKSLENGILITPEQNLQCSIC